MMRRRRGVGLLGVAAVAGTAAYAGKKSAEGQYREQEEQQQGCSPDLLSHIPGDAPMDDATLTVWNGERWVAWDKWRATAPVAVEDSRSEKALPKEPKTAPAAESRPRRSKQQERLW